MTKKSTFDHVTEVLSDIHKDPGHALDHCAELERAVEELQDEDIEIPEGLNALKSGLKAKLADKRTADEDDAPFDNLPI